jgi:hypothetical protein
MKILHNALLYIGFATNTTAAISGSSDGSPTNYILLNGRVVSVEAKVTQVQHPPESLAQVTMNAANQESSVDSAKMQLSIAFMPMEGIYNKSKVHYERLCTVPESPNSVESVTSVVDVDAENATFIIRETSPDNPGLVFDTLCELNGQVYRCDMPTQEVDFSPFGLDAVLTIEGKEYGVWKGVQNYIHAPRQTFTCEGSDCRVEPASNLFGILTEEMPCSSLAVYEYERESALSSQSGANLLIKSVNTKTQAHLDIQNLATEALVDSENEFEAVLFDFQSQQTLASLVWNKIEGSGKILFEADGRKDEVSLQIANIDNVPSFERYNVLLQGLYEAGIAWLSLQNELPSFEQADEKQQLAAQITHIAHGAANSKSTSTVNSAETEDAVAYAEGWAYYPDDSGKSIWVHLYARPDSKSAYRYIGAVFANQHHPDVNNTYGISGDHGFKVKVLAE